MSKINRRRRFKFFSIKFWEIGDVDDNMSPRTPSAPQGEPQKFCKNGVKIFCDFCEQKSIDQNYLKQKFGVEISAKKKWRTRRNFPQKFVKNTPRNAKFLRFGIGKKLPLQSGAKNFFGENSENFAKLCTKLYLRNF